MHKQNTTASESSTRSNNGRGILDRRGVWGWEFSEGRLKPVKSDVGRAPQSFLDIVGCTCKTGVGALPLWVLRYSSACSGCGCICPKHVMILMILNEDSGSEIVLCMYLSEVRL